MEEGIFLKPIFLSAGDRGFIIEFGQGIAPEINARVSAMARILNKNPLQGVTEIIPSYRSILLIYDPCITCPQKLVIHLKKIENSIVMTDTGPCRVVEIPVCYGDDFGPDIQTVEKSANLSSQEVIQLHSEPEYLIYMVGFTPGFPFLGGLNKKLFTPRLKTPRFMVPEGSVGIANNQTGMYPVASPGGWQIIGRTPLKLFAPQRKNPFLYKAGDRIKFIPISMTEYEQLKQTEKN